jgi:transposase
MHWYDKHERQVRDESCGGSRIYLGFDVRRVMCRKCEGVKTEAISFLSDNPFFTERFAFTIGRRCRKETIQDVAKEFNLSWHTVKELEKEYMRKQLERSPKPAPKVIGIDEISIKKGHTYRIVVSDLERKVPIWFGGKDRSEESMDEFYKLIGPEKSEKIRLAVMDMWKPFRNSLKNNAPNAAVLFDKFHIISHLGVALDEVRKSEYRRLPERGRKFIKGQKYVLLSHKENLTTDSRRGLRSLLQANKRLNTAYILKESFGQLWDYNSEAWARKFFDNWKESLKWQRLKPFEKFARMIERHWDGIAAYCKPENKVPLGFVEGLNNKIRVIQRRAYGLRDEEYLRLKILTCMLKEI